MAEDNAPNLKHADDEMPPEAVPAPSFSPHDPLPPPPEITFTRPTLGQAAPLSERRNPPRPGQPAQSTTPSSPMNLGTGMSAGITLASSVVVGFLIGQWIDHHWHLAMPWGTIVFSLTGVVAGFLNLFRILSVSDDQRKK